MWLCAIAVFREDSALKNGELFQCLTDGEVPKPALAASVGVHSVLLVILILVPLLAPQTLHLNYRVTMLAPPTNEPPAPKPIRPAPEMISESLPPQSPPPPPEIALREPEARTAAVPAPPSAAPIALPVIEPQPMPALAVPKPPVVTKVFSGVTLPAAASAPVRNTEAAGFGDTKPGRVDGNTGRLAATGDAGFGDVHGSRDGVAGSIRGGTGKILGAAGFASLTETPRTAAASSKKPSESGSEKPVDIVSKPRPDYTDEARKMRIEGEVLLRVLFTSTGEARVLEVLRGLGHGLNENAIRAAEQIRFKPAERAGQSVDFTAVVHIVFQLAY
jgi:TonB family protein